MLKLSQAQRSEVIKMIDKICLLLTNKIRKEMPDVDDERAEIINYGLHLIIGELPKNFIILGLSYFLGVFKLTLLTVILLLPYRASSGGFHLKTHIGCIVGTTLIYCGVAKISNYIIFNNQIIKIIIALSVWIFGMIMVHLYAPADTESVPILSKKERKQKKILSYIFLSVAIIIACIIHNNEISNILILGYFVQSITITRLAYKLTNNKYGYEVYNDNCTLNT
jgi:accessory gene regulator B